MKLSRNIDGWELQRRVQIACLARYTGIPELAKQLGTSRESLYAAIHTGEISLKRLFALADRLDVSIDFLLGNIPLEITGVWSHGVKKEGG